MGSFDFEGVALFAQDDHIMKLAQTKRGKFFAKLSAKESGSTFFVKESNFFKLALLIKRSTNHLFEVLCLLSSLKKVGAKKYLLHKL